MTHLYFSFFLLLGVVCYSQSQFNRLSVEAAGGFNIPITSTTNINVSDYTIPRHLDIGARYALSKNWSIKLYYAYDRFQNKFMKGVGNTYHRLSIEGYFNLSQRLNSLETSNLNILVHAGVGITHAYPEAIERYLNGGRFTFGETPRITKKYERIGNLILGITTQYRLSNKLALSFDTSFVFNRESQYGYNGELLHQDRTKVNGAFINFLLGLQYSIGKKERHADWFYKR